METEDWLEWKIYDETVRDNTNLRQLLSANNIFLRAFRKPIVMIASARFVNKAQPRS